MNSQPTTKRITNWLTCAFLFLVSLGCLPVIADNGFNTITQAEAFLDNPELPPGSGTSFTLAMDTGNPFAIAQGALDLAGVSVGVHTLYFRFRDDSGLWSSPYGQSFYRGPGEFTGQPGDPNQIVAAEAYIDTDPGAGQGFALPVSADGQIDGPFEILGQQLALPELEIGPHVLHTRFLDRSGVWSPSIKQTFVIAANATLQNSGPLRLVSAEGAIDSRAPVSLDADDGSFNEPVESVTFITSANNSYHRARIQFRDSQGLYGAVPANLKFDGQGSGVASAGTAIRVVASSALEVRLGPSTAQPHFNEIYPGQEYVVLESQTQSDDIWYKVHLPCGNTALCDGWVPGRYLGVVGASPVPLVAAVEVVNTAPLGLNIRSAPNGNVIDSGYDGQRFVSFASSPAGSGCASPWRRIFTPQSSGATSGWVCGDFLEGDELPPATCSTTDPLTGFVTDSTANGAPLAGVSVSVNGNAAATTGSSGYYSIAGLACSSHQISVNHAGYAGYARTFDRTQGARLNIALTKESTTDGVAPNSGLISDPVNTATGNYIYEARDMEIPGPGLPFRFERTYNSRAAGEVDAAATPLGYGWTHNFNTRAAALAGNVTITWGDGRTQTFSPDGSGGFVSQYGGFDTLVAQAGGHRLTRRDRIRYDFAASGQLTSIADRNGNTLTLSYAGANLTQVVDTAGRPVNFAYDSSGRITSVTDVAGRSVAFAYDAAGNLVTATNRRGHATTYTYDANHQILTVVDPRGNTIVSNTYDAAKRVVTYQTDAKGNPTTFDYEELDRVTTVVDPLGAITVHQHNDNLWLIREVDSRGGVSTYEYDVSGNRVRVTDKNGNETRYDYDARGNVTGKTDALGRVTTIAYNTNDDPVQRVDALGRVFTFTYDATGNMTSSIDALGGTGSTTYDTRGLPLVITDALGRLTTYAYDLQGNRITTTDALGFVQQATYDAVGRRTTSTDPLGRVSLMSWDANDNPLTSTDALGGVSTNTYDASDNLVQSVNAKGQTTLFAYDAKDLLIQTTDPLGNSETHAYDALDRRISITSRRGLTTTMAYDSVGNRISETNPLGHVTTYQYDLAGNLTAVTDPRGNTTQFEYDVLNRQTRSVNALGHSQSVAFDAAGNRTSATDALGKVATITYDALDRPLQTTSPLGHTSSQQYDAAGRVISATDAAGRVTLFTYDALDRLLNVQDPAGGNVVYTYDAVGNRLSMQDPNGNTTSYTYDALNRQASMVEAAGSSTAFSYDPIGNLVQRTDPAGAVNSYQYDALNRLVQLDQQGQTPVLFSYDTTGNLLQMTDALGVTTHVYDGADRKTSTVDPFGQTVGYGYDNAGNRTTLVYPGTKTVAYAFDALNRLQSVTDWLGNTTGYAYDALNRPVNMTHPDGSAAAYAYDDSSRLTSLVNTLPGGATLNSYAHVFDAVGNITSDSRSEPLAPVLKAGAMLGTHDVENRQMQHDNQANAFDPAGSRTRKGPETYVFDSSYRLVQAATKTGVNQYQYDGLNNRYVRTRGALTTRYVLDTNGSLANVLIETDAAANPLAYNIYGHGLISRIDAAGTIRIPHFDPRGSTIALTDATGVVTDQYAYDEFGQVANQSGSGTNPFRFLGKHGVQDEGDNLNYVRARYYDAEQKRFISKDPWLGEMGSSQTVNRYAYALNNPVRRIDVSGFSSKDSMRTTSDQSGPTNADHFVDLLTSDAGMQPAYRYGHESIKVLGRTICDSNWMLDGYLACVEAFPQIADRIELNVRIAETAAYTVISPSKGLKSALSLAESTGVIDMGTQCTAVPDRIGSVDMTAACVAHDARWTGFTNFLDSNWELRNNIVRDNPNSPIAANVIGAAYFVGTSTAGSLWYVYLRTRDAYNAAF